MTLRQPAARRHLILMVALAAAFVFPTQWSAVSAITRQAPSPAVGAKIIQVPSAGSNTYYVSTSGSDSDLGTALQPWRTIQKAANSMAAGDTTIVTAGDYAERVHVTISGAAGAPIAYQAEGTVTMNGFTVNANYITVEGFDISNTPDDNQDGWGIFVEGSNCLIDGNYVHYATRGGITIWARVGNEANTSHCTVRNNRLYRNSQVGIEVYGTNNLIEANEIWGTIQYHPNWHNPPSWVDADGISFFGTGHTIRANYIHDISYADPENVNPHIDCFQTFGDGGHMVGHNIVFEQNLCRNAGFKSSVAIGKGFMLGGASDLIIRNNVIQAFCGLNSQSSQRLTIVNNTFASDLSFPPDLGPVGVNLKQTPNSVVKNNIFYNFASYSVNLADSTSQQGADVGHNMMYRSDGKLPSGARFPTDLWQVNPLFASPGGSDFHLQPASPAIDAGAALATVTSDYDGTPRPLGAGYDIGANEFVSYMRASPLSARMNELVTFTISLAGAGRAVTITDSLPLQLVYVSSPTTCSGSVEYNAGARQVTYTGTPPAGPPCVIQISTRVNTSQPMAVTNSAAVDASPMPLQNVSALVILNGHRAYMPAVRQSP